MTSNRNDDHDDFGSEFSLPPDLVPVARPAQVVVARPVTRDLHALGAHAEPQFDMSRLLHAVRRNWLLGMMLGIIAAGPLAFLVWKLNPNEFTAMEFVRIAPTRAALVFESTESSSRADFKSFKNTQRQLLLQPFSLNEAMKDPDVAALPYVQKLEDPIGWLQKQLKVTFPDEAEIMSISLSCEEPIVAHRVVKAVVARYMSEVVEKERLERNARIDNLKEALKSAETKVRKMRSDLSNFVDGAGTGDQATLNLAQQGSLQQLSILRSELSKIDFELMHTKGAVEAREMILNNAKKDQPGEAPAKEGDGAATDAKNSGMSAILAEALENDPAAAKLTSDVQRFENLIQTTRKKYDPKTAEGFIKKYQTQLDEANQKLAERTKRIQRLMDEKSGGATLNQVDVLPVKIGILEKQSAHIREEMKKIEEEAKGFGRSSIDVEIKRQEINRMDPLVNKVSEELEQANIEEKSTSRITLYPSTGVPQIGNSKKRLPLTILAGLVGLFGPLAFLGLRDFLRNHVNHSGMINDGMSISVLGSIPRVPSRVMRRLNEPTHTGARYWRERVAESVTGVTALVLRKVASEGHRVIMVSSATSGEGKSTLAEQLSRSLAESGHRTLLIDFDLRRPVLHQRFGVALEAGASDVLRQGADLKLTARQTESPNLFLLTAGKIRGSLLQEAQNGTLEAFFKECRSEFEIVVVDSSPLLPVVDGRLVGQFADGAILTVAKDTSKVPQIVAARNIMTDYDISLLGCVVMGDNSDAYYNSYTDTTDPQGSISRGMMVSRSMSAM